MPETAIEWTPSVRSNPGRAQGVEQGEQDPGKDGLDVDEPLPDSEDAGDAGYVVDG